MPNDLDVSVPKDVLLLKALESLKAAFMHSFLFCSIEPKGPYVIRVFFETLIFGDEVVIELVHTHHWTEQDGSKVDLDINNLCMFVLDGVLPPELRSK